MFSNCQFLFLKHCSVHMSHNNTTVSSLVSCNQNTFLENFALDVKKNVCLCGIILIIRVKWNISIDSFENS